MKKITAALLTILMALSLTACGITEADLAEAASAIEKAAAEEIKALSVTDSRAVETVGEADFDVDEETAEKNGDIMILFTSDIHCAVDQGFGFGGLQQIRDNLEAQGYETILVDDGDAAQGDAMGTLTDGKAIIELMNDIHYDLAIPGNHEFDYGMEKFLKLTEMADFPYLSCNFNKEGELVFKPYEIIEAAGKKIGFVGVTTPKSITTSVPAYFQDENGKFIYGFMQDETGQELYDAVQKAVDDVRAEGADYVYVMGHLGMEANNKPWTYADVIANTNGIDVFLDGHSHDNEQVVMQNKDGEDVIRSACGTKLNYIGYSHITADEGIADTGIWCWPNDTPPSELFGFTNHMCDRVNEKAEELAKQLDQVIARSDVELTTNDPNETDEFGVPIRMVRRAETNLGDFCADSFREFFDTDVAIMNGGSIRADINAGDITYGDILRVYPYNNHMCVIEVTGQQIMDALEWGARAVPEETGGFLQVSGMSYEIDPDIKSGCKADEENMFAGIEGERRVKNVKVGGEPIDPKKIYTLSCIDYILMDKGDGYTMFEGSKVLQDRVILDNQMLIEYITDNLGGVIGEKYADPYGDGRIVVLDK